MVRVIILFVLLFSNSSFGYEKKCKTEKKVLDLIGLCQKSYYKYAPKCMVGDGSCLSLSLQGLVNLNLTYYKRESFAKNKNIAVLQNNMREDLQEVRNSLFCAKMNNVWTYSISDEMFKIKRFFNNEQLVHFDIPKRKDVFNIPVQRSEAPEILDWDSEAGDKYVFFIVLGERKKLVSLKVTTFIWLKGIVEFDYEGSFTIKYPENCTHRNKASLVLMKEKL